MQLGDYIIECADEYMKKEVLFSTAAPVIRTLLLLESYSTKKNNSYVGFFLVCLVSFSTADVLQKCCSCYSRV